MASNDTSKRQLMDFKTIKSILTQHGISLEDLRGLLYKKEHGSRIDRSDRTNLQNQYRFTICIDRTKTFINYIRFYVTAVVKRNVQDFSWVNFALSHWDKVHEKPDILERFSEDLEEHFEEIRALDPLFASLEELLQGVEVQDHGEEAEDHDHDDHDMEVEEVEGHDHHDHDVHDHEVQEEEEDHDHDDHDMEVDEVEGHDHHDHEIQVEDYYASESSIEHSVDAWSLPSPNPVHFPNAPLPPPSLSSSGSSNSFASFF